MVYEIRYLEDLIVLREWVVRVLIHHCCDSHDLSGYSMLRHRPKIDTHVWTTDRREIDMVISCRGKRICIELKKSDLMDAVDQAIGYLESGWCDVAYVAIDLHTDTIIDMLKNMQPLAQRAFENGIGIVSTKDNIIVVRAYERTSASRKILNLLEMMKKPDET